VICGLGGDDAIEGYGGDDTIKGDSGNGALNAEDCDDRLNTRDEVHGNDGARAAGPAGTPALPTVATR
jgi:hypothetical protein